MEGTAFQPRSSLPPLPTLLTKTLVSTRYPSNHHRQGGTREQSLTWVCLNALLTWVIPDPQSGQGSDLPWPGGTSQGVRAGRADSPGSICPWSHLGVDNA